MHPPPQSAVAGRMSFRNAHDSHSSPYSVGVVTAGLPHC